MSARAITSWSLADGVGCARRCARKWEKTGILIFSGTSRLGENQYHEQCDAIQFCNGPDAFESGTQKRLLVVLELLTECNNTTLSAILDSGCQAEDTIVIILWGNGMTNTIATHTQGQTHKRGGITQLFEGSTEKGPNSSKEFVGSTCYKCVKYYWSSTEVLGGATFGTNANLLWGRSRV
eukprot:3941226-Rhodomonas_salina.1